MESSLTDQINRDVSSALTVGARGEIGNTGRTDDSVMIRESPEELVSTGLSLSHTHTLIYIYSTYIIYRAFHSYEMFLQLS